MTGNNNDLLCNDVGKWDVISLTQVSKIDGIESKESSFITNKKLNKILL